MSVSITIRFGRSTSAAGRMRPRSRENEAPIAVPAPAGNPPPPSLKPFQLRMTNGKPDQLSYKYSQFSTFDRWGGDVSAEFFCRSAASSAAREPADGSSALWLCAETDRDIATSSSTTIHRRAVDIKHLSPAPTSNEDAPHRRAQKARERQPVSAGDSNSYGGCLVVPVGDSPSDRRPADVWKPTSVRVGKQSDAGTRYRTDVNSHVRRSAPSWHNEISCLGERPGYREISARPAG